METNDKPCIGHDLPDYDAVTRASCLDCAHDAAVTEECGWYGHPGRVLDRPVLAPITAPVAIVDWQDWRALWQTGVGLGISLELARELIVDAQHDQALDEHDDRAALVDDLARMAQDRAEGIDDQGPDWRHADPRHSLRYRGEDGL